MLCETSAPPRTNLRRVFTSCYSGIVLCFTLTFDGTMQCYLWVIPDLLSPCGVSGPDRPSRAAVCEQLFYD